MRFQALSVGIQVPPHSFSGTVHSVFRRACNLSLKPGELLTLLLCEQDNVPHGIRLNASSQLVFPALVRVGQPVASRGGILRIDGDKLSVDLRTARLWHIELRKLHIDLRQSSQSQAWAVAWAELQTHHRRNGISRLFSPSEASFPASADSSVLLQQVTRAISTLLRATRNCRSEDAGTAGSLLVGLGPGLTPSGDDFLVGYLAGLWCTAVDNPSRMRFLTALGSELSDAACHTNEISGAYLRSAANGHVSEPIAILAQQLSQADTMSSVRAAAQAALQVGHTSGSDGVLGMLLGCLAWQALSPHLIFSDLLRSSVLRNSTAQL